MSIPKSYLYIAAVALLLNACSKSSTVTPIIPVVPPVTDTSSTPIQSPATENFENGVKADYATSTITLSTGKWSFNNAVIGSTAEDAKRGLKSARIQESGKLSMNFDIVNGVYRVAVASGTYGSDGPSTWQLYASANSGGSYSPVGNPIVTSGNTIQSDTIIVGTISKVRFQIRKIGGAGRLNIDDFEAILTSGPLAPNFADDNNMLLGNPSNATPSILDISNYYMDKFYYSLSYNSQINRANWVSWHLQNSDMGSASRQDDFREDYTLPSTWYYVSNLSYSGSGFDRGHNCPSSDRTSSIEANSSTFLMTNIMPQAPNNNQGPWERLEDSCRRLVQSKGQELFIISGAYGVGGDGNNGAATAIDDNRITVPAYIWKVIVVIPNGNGDYSRISANSRVIAVIMPNTNSINSDWKSYRRSVRDIEAAVTGAGGGNFNLLSNLSTAIQDQVETRVDNL